MSVNGVEKLKTTLYLSTYCINMMEDKIGGIIKRLSSIMINYMVYNFELFTYKQLRQDKNRYWKK
jgi:hypothetical protein